MLITNAIVTRMANALPAQREYLLAQTNNYKAIISKANELMSSSPVDAEQNKKLDELIAVCSLYRAKQVHGDAMVLV